MTSPRPLHRRRSTLSGLATIFLLAAPVAHAQQDPPRTLTGTVTDRQKEPLKGAVVEVKNESTTAMMSYITDASGAFAFKRLSSNDDYRVWATYRGIRSKARELSHFESTNHPVRRLVIQLH